MLEPTNSEILRAVESLDRKFTTIVNDHEARLKGTEKYISDSIAVAKYVAENGTAAQKAAAPPSVSPSPNTSPGELAKTIATIFAFFSGVIALITYILQLTLDK